MSDTKRIEPNALRSGSLPSFQVSIGSAATRLALQQTQQALNVASPASSASSATSGSSLIKAGFALAAAAGLAVAAWKLKKTGVLTGLASAARKLGAAVKREIFAVPAEGIGGAASQARRAGNWMAETLRGAKANMGSFEHFGLTGLGGMRTGWASEASAVEGVAAARVAKPSLLQKLGSIKNRLVRMGEETEDSVVGRLSRQYQDEFGETVEGQPLREAIKDAGRSTPRPYAPAPPASANEVLPTSAGAALAKAGQANSPSSVSSLTVQDIEESYLRALRRHEAEKQAYKALKEDAESSVSMGCIGMVASAGVALVIPMGVAGLTIAALAGVGSLVTFVQGIIKMMKLPDAPQSPDSQIQKTTATPTPTPPAFEQTEDSDKHQLTLLGETDKLHIKGLADYIKRKDASPPTIEEMREQVPALMEDLTILKRKQQEYKGVEDVEPHLDNAVTRLEEALSFIDKGRPILAIEAAVDAYMKARLAGIQNTRPSRSRT